MNNLSLWIGVFAALCLFGAGGCLVLGLWLKRVLQEKQRLIDELALAKVQAHQEIMALTGELMATKERTKLFEDAHAAMTDRFSALSHSAADQLLKRAEENFQAREKLALERMGSILTPVSESLVRFEAKVQALESERAKDSGGLKSQIEGLMAATNASRITSEKLASALRRGAGIQGRWGEETLKNVLQTAGLTHYDFLEQESVETSQGRQRPDVLVRLPGQGAGGVFVIDAKVNLTAFLEAMEAQDEPSKTQYLRAHAQGLRAHVNDLAKKAYWEPFADRAPDFVALFVPGDGFLAAALEIMPDLMSEAMNKKVIIVTPTTLFALCKAVSYGWRVEDSLKNAGEVAELGRGLYDRLSTMGGHISGLGKSLQSTLDRYNDFVGSMETKVLTQARRFKDLGADQPGKELSELKSLEGAPRSLRKLELFDNEPKS
jgi:DNA recombination protein RmuC